MHASLPPQLAPCCPAGRDVLHPALRALAIAAHCFIAQLFLQSGAIVMVTALTLTVFKQPAGMLMAPIAAFYLFVGVHAVRLAGRAAAGNTPLVRRPNRGQKKVAVIEEARLADGAGGYCGLLLA